MKIGIDFDNTIICYDQIFHRIACENGLISENFPKSKEKIRDYLRQKNIEDEWTKMQGYVYGERILEAELFPGVRSFLSFCKKAQIPVKVISHKTRYPYLGDKYDLHRAAIGWIEKNGLLETDKTGLTHRDVFFELTKEAKIERIGQQGCTHFMDDLPEFLSLEGFPVDLKKILFDPLKRHKSNLTYQTISSWSELHFTLFSSH